MARDNKNKNKITKLLDMITLLCLFTLLIRETLSYSPKIHTSLQHYVFDKCLNEIKSKQNQFSTEFEFYDKYCHPIETKDPLSYLKNDLLGKAILAYIKENESFDENSDKIPVYLNEMMSCIRWEYIDFQADFHYPFKPIDWSVYTSS